jgi:hypothetical protein
MVTHTLLKPIYFKQLAFPRGFVERTAADVVLAAAGWRAEGQAALAAGCCQEGGRDHRGMLRGSSMSDDNDDSNESSSQTTGDYRSGSESGCDHSSKVRSRRSGNNDGGGDDTGGKYYSSGGALEPASGTMRRETWAAAFARQCESLGSLERRRRRPVWRQPELRELRFQ